MQISFLINEGMESNKRYQFSVNLVCWT